MTAAGTGGGETGLAWTVCPSPVGELHAGCSAAGLARVSFGPPAAGRGPAGQAPEQARALAAEAGAQLAAYFAGRLRRFRLPVDWSWASQTQQRVLSALTETAGYGQTLTYGQLARLAGLPGAGAAAPAPPGTAPGAHHPPARVVGQVMGANPCPVIVPCHRVVAGNGLGGYSGGTGVEVKRWLLTFEGALPPTLDWDPAGPA